MTKYEEAIYHIVTSSEDHLTVEQIHEELKKQYPKVVMATVYNNVNKLCRTGLIHKVSLEHMPDRYDRPVRHDHMVCEKCGKLKDVSLADLTGALRSRLGEEVLSYDLKIYYRCADCCKREQISQEDQ